MLQGDAGVQYDNVEPLWGSARHLCGAHLCNAFPALLDSLRSMLTRQRLLPGSKSGVMRMWQPLPYVVASAWAQ